MTSVLETCIWYVPSCCCLKIQFQQIQTGQQNKKIKTMLKETDEHTCRIFPLFSSIFVSITLRSIFIWSTSVSWDIFTRQNKQEADEKLPCRHVATSVTSILKSIQTHERLERMLFIRTKTQHANFRGNPIYQATKRHLNNSYTMKDDEKWDGELNHFSVLGRI